MAEKKLLNPLTLEIEEEVWQKFKEITPRTITLNEAVVNLIKEKLLKKDE